MAINFSVVPEPDLARVAIHAENGVPGDSFFILRRDRNGSRLVRETSEAGVVWESDLNSLRTNYSSNPSLETTVAGWGVDPGWNSTAVVKNLATNPLMIPGTTPSEIGRNRVHNPKFVGGSSGVATLWSAYSYLTTATGTRDNTTLPGKTILRAGGQAVNARYGILTNNTTATGNANVPVSCKVKFDANAGHYGNSIVIWADIYTSGGVNVVPADGSHTASSSALEGELAIQVTPTQNWTRIQFYIWIENKTASTIAGTTEYTVWDPIIGTGQVSWNKDATRYFDGDMEDDEDSEYSWAGTVNASESIRTGYAVAQYSQSPSVATPFLVYNGQPSIAIIGGNSTVFDTYVSLVGDAGAMRIGLTTGKQYTVKATLALDRPQTLTLNADARKIVAYTKAGVAAPIKYASTQAPNTAGIHDVTLTFSVPANATEAYIRLYHGAGLGGGVSFWSDVSVTESKYTGPQFNGDTQDTPYVTYTWDGTPNASASSLTAINGRVEDFSEQTHGNWVYQASWGFPNTGGDPMVYFNETESGVAGDKWSYRFRLAAHANKTVDIVTEFRVGTTVVTSVVQPFSIIAANGYNSVVVSGATATATYDNIRICARATGQTMDTANWFRADELLLEKEATPGEYFDGSTQDPAYSGWNGTPGASRSYTAPASVPITLYDYEARQGLETDYVLTDEAGDIGGSHSLVIPNWGTWLKDPFRPYNNIKVYWNQDDSYTRKARRELFIARGAKYPVPQWDKRMAPEGGIRVATETLDQALALTTMLNAAGVIMVDTPLEFGVPIRYVSVGDITGSRAAADKEKDLGWEARYWTLQVDEVDYPVGSPLGQGITYEDVSGRFDSYLALATSVETYEDLASGNWGE